MAPFQTFSILNSKVCELWPLYNRSMNKEHLKRSVILLSLQGIALEFLACLRTWICETHSKVPENWTCWALPCTMYLHMHTVDARDSDLQSKFSIAPLASNQVPKKHINIKKWPPKLDLKPPPPPPKILYALYFAGENDTSIKNSGLETSLPDPLPDALWNYLCVFSLCAFFVPYSRPGDWEQRDIIPEGAIRTCAICTDQH